LIPVKVSTACSASHLASHINLATAMEEASMTISNILDDTETSLIDRYWRAANYLSVGQIYLLGNPMLREPLKAEHIKPRLLGHWGTTPGLNFIYAHLNRTIRTRDLDVLYVCGPGHGGPGMVANAYLEGTYNEVYPDVAENVGGLQTLFKQFSFPGGIPSHVAPETPGSIHEGGELGYALVHAFGAAFDNPDLIVACIVGIPTNSLTLLSTARCCRSSISTGTRSPIRPFLDGRRTTT
jgi:xylulose-5-phosphate/fructose-6-phosphate phosphoketolase